MTRVKGERTKFQQFCIDNGYTAAKVAEIVGISKYTIFAYWRGERLPSRKTMQLMEETLGINAKEMF